MKKHHTFELIVVFACLSFCSAKPVAADEPQQGDVRKVNLGSGVGLELCFIPPGEFMMGSTAEEKEWATGIEGGAQPGTIREKYEGQPRPMRVSEAFWMGRTEVTMAQFRRFVDDTGYITDAEKPGGMTQVFDHEWDRYYYPSKVVHPWKSVADKSWRDPGFGIPMKEDYPVVCVSYQRSAPGSQTLNEKQDDCCPKWNSVFRLKQNGPMPVAAEARRVTISGGETI